MADVAESQTVEQALCLHRLPENLPEGYTRLYFGAEFCPWRFPQVDDLLEAVQLARRAGWAFTLVTPVITEPFLPRLRKALAQILPLLKDTDEVLVSDWGGIAQVREISPQATVVLGRTLSGQKRGPRILDLELSADQKEYFQSGSWNSTEAVALLQRRGIGRIELDNLLQGIAPLPAAICASLHLPFAFVTSSRNCPYADPGHSGPCPAPCGDVFVLESEQSPVPLYQGGNTQFLRNDSLPDNLGRLGIDRLVYHSGLPC